jgi:hypothetical protein
MLRRLILAALILACTVAPLMAGPRPGRQQVSFTLGYFDVRNVDARVSGDEIVAALGYLSFHPPDLNNATFGGDWLVSFGDFIEVGAGVSYYSGSLPSVYADFVNENGSEIRQELKLRIVPITGTVRFLPISKNAPVVPYIGGGVAILPWRYAETGDFVDFENNNQIFNSNYVATGTDVGLVLLGGARFRMGPRYAVGAELRWQKGSGSLPAGFWGDKIDLGGFTYNFTFNARF